MKPEPPLTPRPPPPGRLPFDQVVEAEGAIAGTRDTLLPLKLSSGPQPGGRLFLQGFGTGETPLVLGTAGDIAHELKLGLLEAVKKTRSGLGDRRRRRRRMFSLFAEWGKTD